MTLFRKKLGLAIGGGGARGFSSIPLFEEFAKMKLRFDYVSGASVGAIIGAYYCLHLEVDSLAERFKEMKKKDWANLLDFNSPRVSLIKGEKIKEFLKLHLFGEKTFADLKIPLVIAATRYPELKTEYITEGNLVDAIMASISIPNIFRPYAYKGALYVDAGVTNNLPIDILFEKKMAHVIALDFTLTKELVLGFNTLIESFMQSFFSPLLNKNQEIYLLDKRIFMFRPEFEGFLLDILLFYKMKENIACGKRVLEKERQNFDVWMKQHSF